jgi:hypothetical protein
VAVHVERDGKRGACHDDAESAPKHLRVGAQHGEPACPTAAEREEQKRDGVPERIREREQERVHAYSMRRRDDGDGRQHRPRARHHDEPEAGAEQEAAPHVRAASAREAHERALDQHPHAREQQGCCNEEEQGEGDVAEEVERQAQQVQQPGREEHGQREGGDEARNDGVRAAGASRRRPGQDHGQDRKDTRRQRRDQSGEEPDPEQNEHRPRLRLAAKGCRRLNSRWTVA